MVSIVQNNLFQLVHIQAICAWSHLIDSIFQKRQEKRSKPVANISQESSLAMKELRLGDFL